MENADPITLSDLEELNLQIQLIDDQISHYTSLLSSFPPSFSHYSPSSFSSKLSKFRTLSSLSSQESEKKSYLSHLLHSSSLPINIYHLPSSFPCEKARLSHQLSCTYSKIRSLSPAPSFPFAQFFLLLFLALSLFLLTF
jgi:hypothetical protein